MIKVAPSMLAADYMHLDSEIDKVVASGADVLHYDVMDGTFVPGITFGQGILKMVAKKPIPMDVHLMIATRSSMCATWPRRAQSISPCIRKRRILNSGTRCARFARRAVWQAYR